MCSSQAVDSIVAKGYANKTEIDVVVANELQLLQNLNAFVGANMNAGQEFFCGNIVVSAKLFVCFHLIINT